MAASITNIPLLLPATLLSNSITSHSLPLHLETRLTTNNMAHHRTRPSLVVSREVPMERPTNIHNTSRAMALLQLQLLEAISSIPLLLQVVTMLSMVAELAELADSLSMAKHSNTVATLLRCPMEADHRVRATVTTHLTKRLEMRV